ncbi:MAG: MoxR family ATPase [Gammaproteobacteria bacterium]|nr:MoxR family ATPase [Gammaproteobacteria bacterium]
MTGRAACGPKPSFYHCRCDKAVTVTSIADDNPDGSRATGAGVFERLQANLQGVLRGQAEPIRMVLAALACGGHVLLEDAPGTGKTTLAKALAVSISAHFQRVQFTPDLLPSDIVGVNVFEPAKQAFRFHAGPVFSEVLLADEINRASPRTQSALLEAMAEGQVSVDGTQHALSELFFVIATQNPATFQGTYALPESQLDRFAVRLELGYVSVDEEVRMLADQALSHPLDNLKAVVSKADLLAARRDVLAVPISDEIRRYVVQLVAATRVGEGVALGAGPRASIALCRLAQALAHFDATGFVTPDHVQTMVHPALAHRIMLLPESQYAGVTAASVVARALDSVPSPH